MIARILSQKEDSAKVMAKVYKALVPSVCSAVQNRGVLSETVLECANERSIYRISAVLEYANGKSIYRRCLAWKGRFS
jgi:hypothetical protein